MGRNQSDIGGSSGSCRGVGRRAPIENSRSNLRLIPPTPTPTLASAQTLTLILTLNLNPTSEKCSSVRPHVMYARSSAGFFEAIFLPSPPLSADTIKQLFNFPLEMKKRNYYELEYPFHGYMAGCHASMASKAWRSGMCSGPMLCRNFLKNYGLEIDIKGNLTLLLWLYQLRANTSLALA